MKPQIQFRAITPEDHAEFYARTSYPPGPMFGGIAAFCMKDGAECVMGMVGLDGWTPTCAMAHWYIRQPRCLLPLWNELLKYLTIHGKQKIIGTTPSNNVRALRMIFNKLGWQEIGRIRDGWSDGVDIVISEYRIHAEHRAAA